jgi:D-alanyl-D-alanine carboxypeptidase/D-alanyl-D-alanine carboxypeptidase (penicillin-binding protein 5/6)
VGGNLEKFSRMMNEKANELGLLNTSFVTPSGLDSEGHYTTAYDLARLAAYALNNDDFKTAASSESAVLYYGNEPYRRTITNHNKLLKSYEGLIGVKTGFTKKSGRCLVTAAERDGKRIVAVTLNDKNDWEDHKNLLDYGFSKLVTTKVQTTECIEIAVVGGNREKIKIPIPEVFVNTIGEKEITYKISAEPFIYAPVQKGEKVATLKIYADNKLLKSVDLKSKIAVEAQSYTRYQKFKSIFLKILNSV